MALLAYHILIAVGTVFGGKVIENKDGSLTLSFNVAGTEEIKRWILSQGAHVKVLAPIYLRKIIKAEVKGMLGS
ncbi:WYL domain-containing protein [Candidatus Saganbacteria bacterium]|nr:WYL domain-containing protein [Candidatus Saganbacteria bacterium]